MLTAFISSPLEQFEVVPLISLSLPIVGDFVLSLTNLGLYVILTIVLIIGLHVFSNNSGRLVPSYWSLAIESSYATLSSIVRGQIGSAYEIYTPFAFTLF
jgi:F-type H+-transporting ATPase subunit a